MTNDALLLIAISARALARAARRAGYCPHVLDQFGDQDTQQYAHSVSRISQGGAVFSAEELLRHVGAVLDKHGQIPVVFGAGFESCPELLDEIRQLTPVLGCTSQSIREVSDAERFFAALDELQISHPPTEFTPESVGASWLVKHKGGCGGGHIQHYRRQRVAPTAYFQKQLQGQAGSILFIANGNQSSVLGYHQIWACKEVEDSPFTYGGAVSSSEIRQQSALQLQSIAAQLSQHFGLRGLCGIDFIREPNGQIQVLEVNPRPPATMDLYTEDLNLMQLHLDGCAGKSIEGDRSITTRPPQGHSVVYASNRCKIPMNFVWPSWVSDIPHDGQTFGSGEPVCTIHAQGGESLQLRDLLAERQTTLIAALEQAAA